MRAAESDPLFAARKFDGDAEEPKHGRSSSISVSTEIEFSMQGRGPIKAALRAQADEVRIHIGVLQQELTTNRKSIVGTLRLGYEIKSRKVLLGRLERVLAQYAPGCLRDEVAALGRSEKGPRSQGSQCSF
ncbi:MULTISPECIES: hypothetical protein [unclassified Mesorhizobium]|uniref:hypothetical protein n=1 Tax=unclassified Mesorhizobium TaxID=325217 RepID=UPI00112EB0EA|nr:MULTISPECIES: hypothetical protein [unclassified Mesorhizobium]MBZ9994871.1 hypothetical protein [Mesorhizobium sp. BH1-1-4]TPL93432.1 hypothetical protein FJ948_06000 [Mesorhizobium sp. B2-3-12]